MEFVRGSLRDNDDESCCDCSSDCDSCCCCCGGAWLTLRWLSAQWMMQFAWNMFQHLWHSQMSSVRLTTSMQMGHRYALGSFFFALSCLDMSLLSSVCCCCCCSLLVEVTLSSSSSSSTFVAAIPLVLIVDATTEAGVVVGF